MGVVEVRGVAAGRIEESGGQRVGALGAADDSRLPVFADRQGRTRAGLGLDGRGNSMLTVDQPAEAPEEEGGQ